MDSKKLDQANKIQQKIYRLESELKIFKNLKGCDLGYGKERQSGDAGTYRYEKLKPTYRRPFEKFKNESIEILQDSISELSATLKEM